MAVLVVWGTEGSPQRTPRAQRKDGRKVKEGGREGKKEGKDDRRRGRRSGFYRRVSRGAAEVAEDFGTTRYGEPQEHSLKGCATRTDWGRG